MHILDRGTTSCLCFGDGNGLDVDMWRGFVQMYVKANDFLCSPPSAAPSVGVHCPVLDTLLPLTLALLFLSKKSISCSPKARWVSTSWSPLTKMPTVQFGLLSELPKGFFLSLYGLKPSSSSRSFSHSCSGIGLQPRGTSSPLPFISKLRCLRVKS